jgi:hypothetical protein
MNVRELQVALDLIEKTYEAGGAKSQAKEVASLLKSLDGHADKSVLDFVALVQSKLLPDKSVEFWVHDLFKAGTDAALFDEVLRLLRGNRAISLADLCLIANRFKNELSGGKYVFKFKSKTEVYDFIYDTYLGRALGASKMKAIDDLHRRVG